MPAGLQPFWMLEGIICLCLFPSQRLPAFLGSELPLSSKPAVVGLVISLTLTFHLSPASFKDPCDYIGSTLITRMIFLFGSQEMDCCLINSICNSILSCHLCNIYQQISGITMWMFWGSYYSAYTLSLISYAIVG